MLFSVLAFLEHSASVRSDTVALVDGDTELQFGALATRAQSSAQALHDLGVKKGDRIGICMSKSSDQVIAILGSLYVNAIFVPILPTLKPDNIKHIMNDSGMRFVITDEKRLSEVTPFADMAQLIIGSGALIDEYPHLPYLSKHLSATPPPFTRLGVDVAAIIYSSGSTGRPKGIMVTHRNLAEGAHIVSNYLGTHENDRIAGVLSFNFDYGLNQLWQTLLIGCSLHLHDLVLPNECLAFLARNSITVLPVMPALMTKMFDPRLCDHNHRFDLNSIRYVCSSGGRVSSGMLGNIEKHFPKSVFYSMYGLTEAFRSTYLPPDQIHNRPLSIGKAIPDVEILVLNEQGKCCEPGTPGELVHRGGCITRGYWNDPENTAKRFRTHPDYPGEILVYSGDMVTADSEGYITFINRIDGMLKNNGIRISPTEVEEAVEQHEEVDNCVVFGVENIEVGQDIVVAYTTTNRAVIAPSLLRRFLKTVLPSHMLPKYMVHHRDFPSTGNEGKINRIQVKEASLKELQLNENGVSTK